MSKHKRLILVAILVSSLFFSFSCGKRQWDTIRIEPITIITTTLEYDPVRYQIAQELAYWWTQLGLEVNVVPMEFGDLMAELSTTEISERAWEAFMLLWTGRVERADPDMFIYSIAHSSQAGRGGNNFQAYMSSEYDALAEAQRRVEDPELRRTIVYEAQKKLSEDVPFIALFYRYVYNAYHKDLWNNMISMPGEGVYHEWLPYQARQVDFDDQKWLVIGGNQEPRTLNPLLANSVWEWKNLRLFYDKLARVNQGFRPEPWASESITWINQTTVEVILRNDMKFHDGMPVRPEDVKFSFEYMIEKEVPYFNAFLKPISSIELFGTNGIRFHLREPYAPFVAMTLAQIPILPEHLWKNIEPSSEVVPMIGSGPFVFKESSTTKNILLERNQDHFSAENIGLAGIEYRVYPDMDSLYNAFLNREFDVTGAYLDPRYLDKFSSVVGAGMLQAPDIGFHLLGFDCSSQPFNDVLFRRAIAHAVDLDFLVAEILEGRGDVGGAGQSISTGNPYWKNSNVTRYGFDIEKARDILKDAGYSWDSDGRLQYPKRGR